MGVTSRWINPNAVPLTQDRFSDNGTFSAAKEGKYGYEKVSVGVDTNCVVGKDPDTDEDVEVREEPEPKDPYRPDEGGEGEGGGGGEKPPHLVETVLPSQIVIVKPPKRIQYEMGEVIDYTGIEVQAQLKTGEAWDESMGGFKDGVIPFRELVFSVEKCGDMILPETNAVGSFDTPMKSLSTALQEVLRQVPPFCSNQPGYQRALEEILVNIRAEHAYHIEHCHAVIRIRTDLSYGRGGYIVEDDYIVLFIFAFSNPGEIIDASEEGVPALISMFQVNVDSGDLTVKRWYPWQYPINLDRPIPLETLGTVTGEYTEVYTYDHYFGDGTPPMTRYSRIQGISTIGALFGEDATAIPVKWARPGDGKVLETAFDISMATPVE